MSSLPDFCEEVVLACLDCGGAAMPLMRQTSTIPSYQYAVGFPQHSKAIRSSSLNLAEEY
jgi:hypothetical protein